jgi:DNA-binding transcriptional regulator YiaG
MNGQELKEYRQSLPGNVSQEDMARHFGVKIDTYRSWESGRRHPSGPALALLEKVTEKRPCSK